MKGHELVSSYCNGRITPTIFLVKRVNVVDSASDERVKVDKDVCPFENLRSEKGPEEVCKGLIHHSLRVLNQYRLRGRPKSTCSEGNPKDAVQPRRIRKLHALRI